MGEQSEVKKMRDQASLAKKARRGTLRTGQRSRALFGALTFLAATAVVGLTAPRAWAGDDDDDTPSWSDQIGDSIKNTFSNAGKAVGWGNKPEGPPPLESPSGCPSIAILDGTAGQRIMAPNASGNQGVRYQFSLLTVGRSCTKGGGRISVRVAAGGRVLLGPAGAPGSFDVPVRVVIFDETQQKPISSKLFKVASTISGGQASVPFEFVSDDLSVPATANPAMDYSIKVGIDTGGKGGDTGPAKKVHRRRPKPIASASQ
jgi:hypothetical protein